MTTIKVLCPSDSFIEIVLKGINTTAKLSACGMITCIDSDELAKLLGIKANLNYYTLWLLKDAGYNSRRFRPDINLTDPITKNDFLHKIKDFIIADQAKLLRDEIA